MKLCIARSKKYSYSETFIQNQIRGLSQRADVVTIHTGRLPLRDEKGKLLTPYPFWILHQVTKLLTGKRDNFFSNFGLRRFFRREGVAVVLANYGLTGAHLVSVCRSMNIPLVTIFHGYDATQKKVLHQYAAAYMRMFAYNSAIIAVSTEMKQKLLALGAPEKKIAVIPYGIDPGLFSPGTKKTSYPLFLAVGRFTDKKAPVKTIEAFHQVWQQRPDAHLVMIGDTTGLYPQCIQRVRELDLEDHVQFTGIQTPEQIVSWMQRAWAFVQHSVTPESGDMEGTPNSILEAAACGLPVVSTLHGGIKDAVVNGSTGFLVPEKDVQAMGGFMLRLAGDQQLRETMGAAGRAHILAHYKFDDQMDKMAALLRSVQNKLS